MATFQYHGYRTSGQGVKGWIEALDIKDAREQLTRQGIYTDKIDSATSSELIQEGGKKRTVNTFTRALIYRELAALLASGQGMDEAFEVLIQTPDLRKNMNIIAAARDLIRGGEALSASFKKVIPNFSHFEYSLIRAGENSGSLDLTLDKLAGFLEDQDATQEKLFSALFYPMTVMVLGVVGSFVLFGFVIPHFAEILTKSNIELPLITKIILSLGRIIKSYGLIIAVLIIVFSVITLRRLKQANLSSASFHRRKYKWPVLKRINVELSRMRFSRTFSLLLNGGVDVPSSMEMAGDATGNLWLSEQNKIAVEKVRNGETIANALANVPVLGQGLPAWIRAGEAGGNLADLLENAGNYYQQQWDKRVQRSLVMIEPIIILLVGIFILLIALAILQPLLSLNTSLVPVGLTT